VVGYPLKLQKQGANAQRFIVWSGETFRKRIFHQFSERDRGGGGCIAGAGFGKRNLTRQIPIRSDNRLLHPAMLISKEYLEVEHILTHTLETEVPGLDYACMDRADGYFMRGGTLQRGNLFGIHIPAERIKLRTGFIRR
jgi:hypothetical protein